MERSDAVTKKGKKGGASIFAPPLESFLRLFSVQAKGRSEIARNTTPDQLFQLGECSDADATK